MLNFSLSAQRVEELEEALKKKDEEMKQMEERYKKYLEKAKSVSEIPFLKDRLQDCAVPVHACQRVNLCCESVVYR